MPRRKRNWIDLGGPIRICFPELPANTSAASREVPDFLTEPYEKLGP